MNATEIPAQGQYAEMDGADEALLAAMRSTSWLPWPDDIIEGARVTDRLYRAYTAAAQELAAFDPEALRRRTREALKKAAASGADLDALIPNREILREDLEWRAEMLRTSAVEVGNRVHANLRNANTARALGGILTGGLADVLDAADKPARIMVDATNFDYADPASVHRADKPVQQAFAALLPLAERHDAIRAAAVDLAQRNPDWPGICDPQSLLACKRTGGIDAITDWPRLLGFAGYGVQMRMVGHSRRWEFRPQGHPVARLVEAATRAAEPFRLPPDERPRAERRFSAANTMGEFKEFGQADREARIGLAIARSQGRS
jgi:hypothetical protein